MSFFFNDPVIFAKRSAAIDPFSRELIGYDESGFGWTLTSDLSGNLSFQPFQPNSTFYRDFATLKTLNHGEGPNITFTRGTSATYFDSAGVLRMASINEPRFDHTPATNSSLGLLIEEQRTNLFRNSTALNFQGGVIGSGGQTPSGDWSYSGNNSVNGIIAEVIGSGVEDGIAYLDMKFSGTPTSGSSIKMFRDAIGANAVLDAHSFSLYCKLLSGTLTNVTSCSIRLQSDAGSSGTPRGALIGSPSIQTFTPTSDNLRKQRSAVTHTNVGAAIRYWLDIEYTVNQPLDFTLRIAAPQLEVGAFATSYIPTPINGTATRSADIAVVTPISSFYNQAEGTVVARYSRISALGVGSQIPWMLSDNSESNIVCVTDASNGTSDRVLIASGGVSQMNTGSINYSANQEVARAVGIKADDCATSANGASVVTDNTVTLPSVDRLTIGFAPYFASSRLNGHIRKITYWPKRLSNALLQQLTT